MKGPFWAWIFLSGAIPNIKGVGRLGNGRMSVQEEETKQSAVSYALRLQFVNFSHL